ncbi:hypothetical protein AB205_0133840 [Aquarana catesbeiana]|uniref:Uncharacterized protein n=1 Tax=Aquarana catesbeiana TaxID=8400 RepID=A0A2G9S1L8_AQUCT|nr:hypothetical protein AB205_0133840 [Aquarana catesbeiana]
MPEAFRSCGQSFYILYRNRGVEFQFSYMQSCKLR